jgi:hypothetical protein
LHKLFGLSAVAAIVAVAPLKAQEIVTVPREPANLGLQASYAEDAHFGIGIRYENDVNKVISSAPARLHFIFAFDYFFPEAPVDTYYEGNVNLTYQFGDMRRAIGPYFGGGLNYAHAEGGGISDSEVGLNILGGIRFRSASKMVPFLEVRYELGGGEQFVLTGGILFF